MAEFTYGRVQLNGGEDAFFVIDYEVGTLRINDLVVRNGSVHPLILTVAVVAGGVDVIREVVLTPGETRYPIPGNRRLTEAVDSDTGEPTFRLPVDFSWSATDG